MKHPTDKNNKIVLFESRQIRRVWHENEWYYSVVDVVEVLAETDRPRKYWSDLKKKIEEEGYFQLSEKIGQLKMIAHDGKKRETDCANTDTILRIIQSIPSKKAEPFKRWLAQVGKERLDEIENPELDTHKFHNFVLRNLLEGIEEIREKSTQYEMIIDRYISGEEPEKEVVRYIQNTYTLPKFESIVQVNSIYCEPIQAIDLLFRGLKNNALRKELLTEVKGLNLMKKEKGPDYPMGPVPNSSIN